MTAIAVNSNTTPPLTKTETTHVDMKMVRLNYSLIRRGQDTFNNIVLPLILITACLFVLFLWAMTQTGKETCAYKTQGAIEYAAFGFGVILMLVVAAAFEFYRLVSSLELVDSVVISSPPPPPSVHSSSNSVPLPPSLEKSKHKKKKKEEKKHDKKHRK